MRLLSVFVAGIVLAACAGSVSPGSPAATGEVVVVPPPTARPLPTAPPIVAAVETPIPTRTPAPTSAPVPTPRPTPTASPANTATPTPAPTSTPTPAPSPTATAAPTAVQPAVREIRVDLTAALTFDPKDIQVSPGEVVTFVINDTSGFPHTFTIAETTAKQRVLVDVDFAPNASQTVQVTFPTDVGQLYLVCRIHEVAGMTGDVHVGDAAPASGPPAPASPAQESAADQDY